MTEPSTLPLRFDTRELAGALGDLGTLLPLTLAAIALAGLSPLQVFAGFGLFYIATGIVYRLPVPVQPMKAVAAVILVGQVSPATVAAGGAILGAVLLVLGATGLIDRLRRLVPQSVLAGLQLGLGLALGWFALGLMAEAPFVGMACLATAALMLRYARHAAAATLGVGLALGSVTGAAGLDTATGTIYLPGLPDMGDLRAAVFDVALPQLALTLTNAVILTALVAGDCFGARAGGVTPRRLCLTSGAANLLLTPLGALPMCHGAGGVAAHHRFGARTGGAPIMLGAVLIAVALAPAEWRGALFAALPIATLGALMLIASADLAFSRRLIDCQPSCRPVIAVTAAITLATGPFAGLIAGTLAEIARKALLARLAARRND